MHSILVSESMQLGAWKAMAMAAVLFQLCSLMVMASFLPSNADEITELPGQPEVSFRQFSGYITVDELKHRALFYYFAEAESEPSSKPLVLWLNGGPGCSSLGIGAFSENGPFRSSGKVLVRNEYSWNKEANMLYLEAPAGVGFSYSNDSSFYVGVNDTITAWDNLEFLRGWFIKFPEYMNRDLYITGESYAGHYVPQLAQLLVQYNLKEKLFNLRGIAIGNPLLEFSTDFNSQAEYLWSHGLISDSTYSLLTNACNSSRSLMERFRGNVSTICSRVMSQVKNETSRYVDKFAVTSNICIRTSASFAQSVALGPHLYASFTEEATGQVDACAQEKATEYLNRRDVQDALHAKLNGVANYTFCSRVIEYDDLNWEIPMIPTVGSLVESGIRVLIYSGDQDSVIPLTGSRTIVQRLADELGLKTTLPYRVWFQGQQVGGWTQEYGNMLSFATIRDASHIAPLTQPERCLVLFRSFVQGKPPPESF